MWSQGRFYNSQSDEELNLKSLKVFTNQQKTDNTTQDFQKGALWKMLFPMASEYMRMINLMSNQEHEK